VKEEIVAILRDGRQVCNNAIGNDKTMPFSVFEQDNCVIRRRFWIELYYGPSLNGLISTHLY